MRWHQKDLVIAGPMRQTSLSQALLLLLRDAITKPTCDQVMTTSDTSLMCALIMLPHPDKVTGDVRSCLCQEQLIVESDQTHDVHNDLDAAF